MELYTLDDDLSNAGPRSRDRSHAAVLRPVRPVTVTRDRQPAAAPAAAPVYVQPQEYAQPTYINPAGYAPPGYMQGYAPPGYPPGWAPGRPYGWNGPNGAVFYNGASYAGPWGMWGSSGVGMGGQGIGQSLASGLGSLVEIGTSLIAAFQGLPAAPTADESLDLANLTEYQRKLAEHAKGDERLRTIGSAGGKVIDLAVRLFSNPSSGMGAFSAPRAWY
jgi:hypothetical protein